MQLHRLFVIALCTLPGLETLASPWFGMHMTRLSSAPFAVGEGARLEAEEYRLTAGWPAGSLETGIDYRYTRYEYEGLSGRNRDLHRLELPLVFSGDSHGWRWQWVVAPGVSASSNVFKEPLERWSRDDLTLRVAAQAEGPPRNHWRWLVGLSRDQRFGRPLVYPTLGAAFERGRWSLRLAVPDSEIRYRRDARQTLTARLYPAGHRWHVVSDELAADFDYRVRAVRADLTLSIGLPGTLIVDVAGGYEFARRHRLTDDTGARLSAGADGQWAVTIGLRTSRAPLP